MNQSSPGTEQCYFPACDLAMDRCKTHCFHSATSPYRAGVAQAAPNRPPLDGEPEIDAWVRSLGWFPIDTAPKPNVDVLLWYPWAAAPRKGAPEGFRYIARWTGTDDGADCWRDPVDFEPVGDSPTHWMPLPDGPSPVSSTDRAPAPSAWQPVVNEIAVERQRQINQEGWTRQYDDSHRGGELAIAAGWYALNSPFVGHPECIGDPADGGHEAHRLFAGETAMHWPWSREWWKPKNSRSDLVRAAALIVAEIERLDRAALTRPQPGGAVAGTHHQGPPTTSCRFPDCDCLDDDSRCAVARSLSRPHRGPPEA